PFFTGFLEEEKYQRDCLYYLLDIDRKVAASRLFLGHEYDFQTKKLEDYFGKPPGACQSVTPDRAMIEKALQPSLAGAIFYHETMQGTGPFPDFEGKEPDLSLFDSFEMAYHKMMIDFTYLQKISIELVNNNVKRLY